MNYFRNLFSSNITTTDRCPEAPAEAGGRVWRCGEAALHLIGRLPRYLVLLPVYIYRLFVSPMLPDTCIYTPSCSHYTVDAVLTHGALRGLALGASRVVRCSGGLFEGGYDPVPERFSFAVIREGFRTHRRHRRGRAPDKDRHVGGEDS
ncbi:MAG: membrane protein insertion efficiency factor YidD [Spirochaetaceae bacterium]